MSDATPPADINPYAPPSVLDPVAQPGPGVGVWRDGPLLVMHQAAELPRVCIYTGESAVGAREFRLLWKRPGDVFTRERHLYLPLNRTHLRAFAAQRRQSLVGLMLGGVSLLAVFVAPALLPVLGDKVFLFVVPPGLLLGFVGIMMWFSSYYATRQPLLLVHAADDYLWFEGVNPDFLAHLPPWPK